MSFGGGSARLGNSLDIARAYTLAGWRVLPVGYRRKNPDVGDDWDALRLEHDELPRYFNGAPQNVGVLLGEPSNWLVDVDLDCLEAIRLAPSFLPQTAARFGRASKPLSHYLYVASGTKTKKFRDIRKDVKPDGKVSQATLVELRSTGGQTVFPGSTHEIGEAIDWAGDLADSVALSEMPAVVGADDLKGAVIRLAIASQLIRLGYPEERAREASFGEFAELPDELVAYFERWLGIERLQPKSSTAPSGSSDEVKIAAERFNADRPMQLPKSGGECPICGHKGCFGKSKYEGKWACFSTGHPDDLGRANDDCVIGDALDLEVHARGKSGVMARVEILKEAGYLAPRQVASGSSSPVSPPPHDDSEHPSSPSSPAAPKPPDLFGQDALTFLGDEDDVEDDSKDWVVRGLVLRAAPNIFAGMPKSKKTILAIHLCLAVAAGEKTWLGRFPISPGRVLILSYEDPRRETRRRVWRLARGLGYDPRTLAGTLRIADRSEPFHFDKPAEMARLEGTLAAWRPSIVLMDSLSRVHLGDENSKKDMNVVTDAWLTLAARYDLAIVSIHHLKKNLEDGQSIIMQLRGSGDIGAAVRHVVAVKREKEDSDRLKIQTDGNAQYQPDPFEVQVTDDNNGAGKPIIVLTAPDGPAGPLAAVEATVMLALVSGPQSSRGLRTACKGIPGVRNQMVDEVAERLRASGRIERMIGGGPWKLS